MTQQQLATIEQSLTGLTALDKLELAERLLHELRSVVAEDRQQPANDTRPLSEAEFKQRLLASGLMASLPIPPDSTTRPAFQPVTIEGEPLSETILRERR
jgi:hypothetical protein